MHILRKQISLLTTKPLAIAETATLGQHNGKYVDKPTWLREAWKAVAMDFPRIIQVWCCESLHLLMTQLMSCMSEIV